MKTTRNALQTCLIVVLLLSVFTGGAQPVIKIGAGSGYSLFLKSDGNLWGMGTNSQGQLGDGNYNKVNRPKQIVTNVIDGVTAMAAGFQHSLLLKSDGSLWAMGANSVGQLGDGTYFQTNRPELILASNVTAIAAGYRHSLLLRSDGSLWAMGDNEQGQLGDGTHNNYTNRPEQIMSSNVMAIAAGDYHSLFLKHDGSLWAMGDNYYGQLGNGGGANAILPVQILASNVVAIAAGGEHSLFLKKDGSLWGMGNNGYGQLGDGTFNSEGVNTPEQILASNVTAIAAGEYHSLLIKTDSSLSAMGDNAVGELGDGTYNPTNQPEQIVASGVTSISAGNGHSLFSKNDGSLWAMGANVAGQLGNGNYTPTNRPEQIVANPNYNKIYGKQLSGSTVLLSFWGSFGANYALDRSIGLAPPNWLPQATNSADSFGALVFTNSPDPATNNFWRIRSVP